MNRNKLPRYMWIEKNTYYVRIAVPKLLRGIYGKSIIVKSLGTSDYAKAIQKKDIVVGEIKAGFAQKGKADLSARVAATIIKWGVDQNEKATFEASEGTVTEGEKLAQEAALEEDPKRKAELKARLHAYYQEVKNSKKAWQGDLIKRLGRFRLLGADMLSGDKLQELIINAGLAMDAREAVTEKPFDFSLHEIAEALSGKELGPTSQAQIKDAIPSVLMPERLRPYIALSKSKQVPSDANVTLGQLIEAFFKNPKRASLDPDTKRNYDATVAILNDVIGKDMPVRSISRDTIRTVQNVIIHLPPRARNMPEYGGMTYIEIAQAVAEKLAKRDKVKLLGAKTRNKYLRNISTIFRYAYAENKIDANPAMDLSVTMPNDRNEDRKEALAESDLMVLFPKLYRLEGLNWIPLVMLYSGMRPTEAAQLDVADVVKIDEVWCFDIDAETKGKKGDSRWGDKSIKNDRSSKRRLPIHQKLIELGFIKYVNERRKAQKLFDVKRYGNGGYFESIRHEFYEWMDALGVRTSTKTPHSFRHTWRTQAFQAMTRQDFAKIMGGWTLGKGVDVGTYLHKQNLDMKVLKDELDKIKFNVLAQEPQSGRKHAGLIAAKRIRRYREKVPAKPASSR
jgi:integrase